MFCLRKVIARVAITVRKYEYNVLCSKTNYSRPKTIVMLEWESRVPYCSIDFGLDGHFEYCFMFHMLWVRPSVTLFKRL